MESVPLQSLHVWHLGFFVLGLCGLFHKSYPFCNQVLCQYEEPECKVGIILLTSHRMKIHYSIISLPYCIAMQHYSILTLFLAPGKSCMLFIFTLGIFAMSRPFLIHVNVGEDIILPQHPEHVGTGRPWL